MTIADVLNTWNQIGVFSYVLPFLLIFAVVYAIIDKTKLLASKKGEDYVENKGITAIVAVAMALMSLQFDFVSNFFAVIFPRFGIGLSIFLVLLIFLGFFNPDGDFSKHKWVGYAVGIGVVLWSVSSWGVWSGTSGFGGWFGEYIWSIVVLGIIIGLIAWVTKK